MWVGIWFIFKLTFPVFVGEEKHLTRRVDTATVERVLYPIDVAQAAAAPVEGVVPPQVGLEATEVLINA